MLSLLSFMHAFVDGICASVMLGQITPAFTAEAAVLVLFYNLLAFSTQGLTGLLTDRIGHHRELTLISAALLIAGLLFPCPPLASAVFKTCLVGLGNSLFHVAGGAKVITRSAKKALPLGIFVAPGAMGLTLGTLFPSLGGIFAVLLAACCVGLCFIKDELPSATSNKNSADMPLTPMVLFAAAALLFCIFSRAFGGSIVAFPWKSTALLSIITTAAVVAGKMLGGLLCDRFGAVKTTAISIPLAAVLVIFCSQWMLPSLAGQLLLNLSMPISLWLLCLLLPQNPGFAFGLAASFLYPGTLFAMFLPDAPLLRTSVSAAVFVINTVLMIFAAVYISKRSKTAV
ncbi:MAG: hypothetical protein IJC94_07765 [Oscillospiraceae bacterium]|nr:hypothetical protein [Oscillospiraceae bacterium]MBQ9939269.1 hypothetical protein [Oscillospiraceae bacterium]